MRGRGWKDGIMTELTEPILKALDEQDGQPLQLVDPRSGVASG